MKLWNWIKIHVLRRKPSLWIKKKFVITYWTRRDAESEIEIPEIRFKPAVEVETTFYVDKLFIDPRK